MQKRREDIFSKLTGRATEAPRTTMLQKAATVRKEAGNVFQELTSRATKSALDKKIEVPDEVRHAAEIGSMV